MPNGGGGGGGGGVLRISSDRWWLKEFFNFEFFYPWIFLGRKIWIKIILGGVHWFK